MTLTVTHTFVSAVPDGADTSVVRPSNWNATHTITGTFDAAQMPALTGDVTTPGGSLVTTLAAGNAGNLNSGTLLAARMPALTGDITTSAGAVATTLASIIVAGGPIGSATVTPIITYDAKGRLTAVSSATIAPAAGSITGGGNITRTDDTNVTLTLGGTPNGSVITGGVSFTLGWTGTLAAARLSNTAVTPGSYTYGSFTVDQQGRLTAASSGTAPVTSITPGNGLTSTLTATAPGSAITTTGTLSGAELVNAQTGTTYTFVDGDRAKLVTASNAAAQAYTLPQAGASSAFQAGWYCEIRNKSTNAAGILTITPTTSTIDGAATLVLNPGRSARIVSDGTNYQVATTGGKQTLPTTQVFTSGSGTYTTPANVLWLEIEMGGPGGGGSGGGSGGSPGTSGSAGSAATTFGSSLLTANVGNGATVGGGAGSAGTGGSATGGYINWTGGDGEDSDSAARAFSLPGGGGGASTKGGQGFSAVNGDGHPAKANTGSGGGGAGGNTIATMGSGGGAGGSLKAIINSPAATYAYAVGAGGAGGTAGTAGNAGGAGAAGYIIVIEHYS